MSRKSFFLRPFFSDCLFLFTRFTVFNTHFTTTAYQSKGHRRAHHSSLNTAASQLKGRPVVSFLDVLSTNLLQSVTVKRVVKTAQFLAQTVLHFLFILFFWNTEASGPRVASFKDMLDLAKGGLNY